MTTKNPDFATYECKKRVKQVECGFLISWGANVGFSMDPHFRPYSNSMIDSISPRTLHRGQGKSIPGYI